MRSVAVIRSRTSLTPTTDVPRITGDRASRCGRGPAAIAGSGRFLPTRGASMRGDVAASGMLEPSWTSRATESRAATAAPGAPMRARDPVRSTAAWKVIATNRRRRRGATRSSARPRRPPSGRPCPCLPLLLGLLGSIGYVGGWFGPDTVDIIESKIITFSRTAFSESVVDQLISPTVDRRPRPAADPRSSRPASCCRCGRARRRSPRSSTRSSRRTARRTSDIPSGSGSSRCCSM